mmetsp:Transcript_1814/g.4028  ORF Transcript_1814/g.4028 Transcript_1814/m.4028 type:complete len:261 (+) Transcript_1814:1079-1861(+)
MQATDRHRLPEAQTPELCAMVVHHLEAIALAHRHDDTETTAHVVLVQVLGDIHVLSDKAHIRVDAKDRRYGFVEGDIDLRLDLPFEGHILEVVVEHETPSVDHLEHIGVSAVVRVFSLLVRSVPCDARLVPSDAPGAVRHVADLVHERRLPHIRPSDHRNDGPCNHLRLVLLQFLASDSDELHRWEAREDLLVVKDPPTPVLQLQVEALVQALPIDRFDGSEGLTLPQDLASARRALVGQGAHCDALSRHHVLALLELVQ